MAQNEETLKSQNKSPNAHLTPSCVPGTDSAISSFDFLNSAAMLLKAAADRQNPGNKSVTLPNVSPLSKQRCLSPNDGESSSATAAAAAAAASLISCPPRQHSPTTSSKIQAALVMAMAASSPPSTCPSSSSSGHPGEHSVNDFRNEAGQSSLGAFFRPPPPAVAVGGGANTSYESVDGGPETSIGGVFPSSGHSHPPPHHFVPFTSSSGVSNSASTCLTNAMLLPASLVNALGQQMQSNQYHQDHLQQQPQQHQSQSPAYLSTINTNSAAAAAAAANAFSQQQHSQGPLGEAQLFQSVVGGSLPPQLPPRGVPMTSGPSEPSSSAPNQYHRSNAGSSLLHEETNNKREQRLLKNREAARECRRKKKEYVRCLERQVSILQDQNRQLIEELQKMKALCAGAYLDPNGGPPLQTPPPPTLPPPSLSQQQQQQPDRRLMGGGGGGGGGSGVGPSSTDGMDFVDGSHQPLRQKHSRHPPRLSSPHTTGSSDASGNTTATGNNYHTGSDMTTDSPVSRQELTLLKASHQMHLISGGGSDEGVVRKSDDGDFGGSGDTWMAAERKPKFPKQDRPQATSPHIHPVKRVLKRFGNEQQQQQQHRLSQQKLESKPDPDQN